MRIARFRQAGQDTWGFLDGGALIDRRSIGVAEATVREFIAAGHRVDIPDAVRRTPIADVTLLPPVELGKVVCAGANYGEHRAEASIDPSRPPYPTIFTRFPDSHVGHDEDLRKPSHVERFDYEGELAVVIGRRADEVRLEDALDHVYGYACFNDGSARDWQTRASQWIPGKNFLRSGSIGPVLVTADEVPDLGRARIETRVNGEVRQRARIEDMIFSIAELIAYVSAFTPLEAGDVIATGTPGGVGLFMDPPTFLVPGDIVEVEIDGVGLLRNRIGHA